MIHVQPFNGGPPVGDLHLVINLKGLQPELLHPHRVALFLGQLINDLGGQTRFHAVSVLFLIPNIINAAVNILYQALFSHALVTDPRSAFRNRVR